MGILTKRNEMERILMILSSILVVMSYFFLVDAYSGEIRIEIKEPKQTINWEDPNLRRKSGCGCKK